jgi:YD repeat-containing protein
MIRKLISALFAIVVLQGMVNVSAEAQTGNNCAVGRKYFFGEPRLAGSYACSGYPGTYQYVCLVQTSSCSPFAAPQETCPRCPNGGGPISLATGNTFIDQVDVALPGLAGGLTLRRTWNSMWPLTQALLQLGMFGPNWRSTFEERIFVGGDNYIKYGRSDGSFWSFGVNTTSGSDWAVAAPANIAATLEQGTSFWTLTFQNGEKRQFDNTTGNLIAIIDRNGNTTQLTYDTSNRLTTVADPASRHLTFTYASPSSYLVTGVSSDVGLSLSYSYDSQGRLSTVTKPDLTTVSFTYNAQSLITSVTDSNGKVLESHTYDSSWRGLSSSQANGVNALTLTYPQ